jgi:hypothetical protein
VAAAKTARVPTSHRTISNVRHSRARINRVPTRNGMSRDPIVPRVSRVPTTVVLRSRDPIPRLPEARPKEPRPNGAVASGVAVVVAAARAAAATPRPHRRRSYCTL